MKPRKWFYLNDAQYDGAWLIKPVDINTPTVDHYSFAYTWKRFH